MTKKLKNGFHLFAKLRKFVRNMGKSIWVYILAVMLAGCRGNIGEQPESQSDSIYISAVTHERQQKDDAFAMSPNSPFRDVKEEFTGLRYYPISPGWKVKCLWDKNHSGEVVSLPDSKGQKRTYTAAGTFKFRLHNRECQIPAYFEDSAKTMFFIMFRDSTNQSETYPGGRYIEFRHAGGDEIVLDFNRAFNPYCHYNHNYACPVVPATHYIPLPVRAGERKYGSM
jgi:uncharacterized protein (DUF1684 family)